QSVTEQLIKEGKNFKRGIFWQDVARILNEKFFNSKKSNYIFTDDNCRKKAFRTFQLQAMSESPMQFNQKDSDTELKKISWHRHSEYVEEIKKIYLTLSKGKDVNHSGFFWDRIARLLNEKHFESRT